MIITNGVSEQYVPSVLQFTGATLVRLEGGNLIEVSYSGGGEGFANSVTATLSALNNDYPLASGVGYLRLTPPAGGAVMTGLSSANITPGAVIYIKNWSETDSIIFTFGDSRSQAANQFDGPGGEGETFLGPRAGVLLVYDGVAGVWNV